MAAAPAKAEILKSLISFVIFFVAVCIPLPAVFVFNFRCKDTTIFETTKIFFNYFILANIIVLCNNVLQCKIFLHKTIKTAAKCHLLLAILAILHLLKVG